MPPKASVKKTRGIQPTLHSHFFSTRAIEMQGQFPYGQFNPMQMMYGPPGMQMNQPPTPIMPNMQMPPTMQQYMQMQQNMQMMGMPFQQAPHPMPVVPSDGGQQPDGRRRSKWLHTAACCLTVHRSFLARSRHRAAPPLALARTPRSPSLPIAIRQQVLVHMVWNGLDANTTQLNNDLPTPHQQKPDQTLSVVLSLSQL